MPIDKVLKSFDEAVSDAQDGWTVNIGGFGGPFDSPCYLIAALARKNVSGLTITANAPGLGPAQAEMIRQRMATLIQYPRELYQSSLLIERGQVRKGVFAFAVAMRGGLENHFEKLLEEGSIEHELIGQGTIAERMRAARAGIAGFYTPVGPGTFVADGKEVRWFDGRPHVFERAVRADLSIIRARRADRWGNLVYHGTSRTFNATMAGAARMTIAEVDEVVEVGELDPECIVTPAPFVQRVVIRPDSPCESWEDPC
jgi:3-oxoacid CoA-transferase A subunit